MNSIGDILSNTRQRVWNLLIRRTIPSPAPYGSHIPVLMVAERAVRPKRILELGGGFFSTPLFLNRKHFPTVENLITIETDHDWLARLRSDLGSDPRWELRSIHASMPDWIQSEEAMTYVRDSDLIFVDDSTNSAQRAKTLAQLLSQHPGAPIIAHDVDQYRLRRLLWQHRPYVVFDSFLPQTGFLNCPSGEVFQAVKRASVELRKRRTDALKAVCLQDWVIIGEANAGV